MPLDLPDSKCYVLCVSVLIPQCITGHNSIQLAWLHLILKYQIVFLHSHLILSAIIFVISPPSRLSKTGTFVAFQEVDKSIHQKILCGETQSRKVMSAGKEQIKLALN